MHYGNEKWSKRSIFVWDILFLGWLWWRRWRVPWSLLRFVRVVRAVLPKLTERMIGWHALQIIHRGLPPSPFPLFDVYISSFLFVFRRRTFISVRDYTRCGFVGSFFFCKLIYFPEELFCSIGMTRARGRTRIPWCNTYTVLRKIPIVTIDISKRGLKWYLCNHLVYAMKPSQWTVAGFGRQWPAEGGNCFYRYCFQTLPV